MIRSLLTAALVLVFGLSAAGCGGAQNASTSAYRWNDAQVQQRLARGDAGAEDDSGHYWAGDDGRVKGFHNDSANAKAGDNMTQAEDPRKDAGNGMMQGAKDAGEDMARGAEKAAKSIGSATEETLDMMTGTPKNSSR